MVVEVPKVNEGPFRVVPEAVMVVVAEPARTTVPVAPFTELTPMIVPVAPLKEETYAPLREG